MEILRYFEYAHLPPKLQEVSAPFYEMAHRMHQNCEPSEELAMGMRKLLEAKDCMVRAALVKGK